MTNDKALIDIQKSLNLFMNKVESLSKDNIKIQPEMKENNKILTKNGKIETSANVITILKHGITNSTLRDKDVTNKIEYRPRKRRNVSNEDDLENSITYSYKKEWITQGKKTITPGSNENACKT
jgi:hypothetical protein